MLQHLYQSKIPLLKYIGPLYFQVFTSEGGGTKVVPNVGILPQRYVELQPKGTRIQYSLP